MLLFLQSFLSDLLSFITFSTTTATCCLFHFVFFFSLFLWSGLFRFVFVSGTLLTAECSIKLALPWPIWTVRFTLLHSLWYIYFVSLYYDERSTRTPAVQLPLFARRTCILSRARLVPPAKPLIHELTSTLDTAVAQSPQNKIIARGHTECKQLYVSIRRPLVCLVLQKRNFWITFNAYVFIPFVVLAQPLLSFLVVVLIRCPRAGLPPSFALRHVPAFVSLIKNSACSSVAHSRRNVFGCFPLSHSFSSHCCRAPSQDKLRSGFTYRAFHPPNHVTGLPFLSRDAFSIFFPRRRPSSYPYPRC